MSTRFSSGSLRLQVKDQTSNKCREYYSNGLGGLEVAGRVLGDGDVGGHPAGDRITAMRELCPCPGASCSRVSFAGTPVPHRLDDKSMRSRSTRHRRSLRHLRGTAYLAE
jgi:hypothetical protein